MQEYIIIYLYMYSYFQYINYITLNHKKQTKLEQNLKSRQKNASKQYISKQIHNQFKTTITNYYIYYIFFMIFEQHQNQNISHQRATIATIATIASTTITPIQSQIQIIRKQLIPDYEDLNQNIKNRTDDVLTVLLSAKDIKMIQSFSRLGLMEQTPLLRSHVWKCIQFIKPVVLLESLPVEYSNWNAQKKENYQTYIKIVQSEYRINENDQLQFQQNKFDEKLWNLIMLDSKRTHSQESFFSEEVNQIRIYPNKPTKHFDIITRILYIWAKMNGAVGYVQGMNQILAPLYYLEFQHIKKQTQSEVFYMFTSLITSIIDMHIKEMDKSQIGIHGRMQTLNKYVKAVDFQLWSKLQKEQISPEFYSFRWLALILSQQFGLFDIMKVWDLVLSYNGADRFRYLYCMCVSILILRKNEIMKQDFNNILPKLQKIDDLDVSQILEISIKLYQKINKINIQHLLIRQQQIRNEKKTLESQTFYHRTETLFKTLMFKQKTETSQ